MNGARRRHFAGPLRDGNRFTLLGDGRRFLAGMLAAIEASRHYVLAEFYLVESGAVTNDFIAALLRARARGVRAAVIFDAFGARGLHAHDRARMLAGGIELQFFNAPRWGALMRALRRDHRKLLIADGAVGYTGGAGLSDLFSPDANPDTYWQDCMVEMSGPVLADWHRLFAHTWRRCAHHRLDIVARRVAPPSSGERGRLIASAGLGRERLGQSVIRHVQEAQRRVWIATAYFWPSMRLRRALRRAARRGLDVRLILTGPHTDAPALRTMSRLFYDRLMLNGVVIYEYQQRFLHCKLSLCDDWVSVGSSNLDRWGALWNLDANQEIDSPDFARQVESAFGTICRESLALHAPAQLHHPWRAYLWRRIARAVMAWSTRELQRLRR